MVAALHVLKRRCESKRFLATHTHNVNQIVLTCSIFQHSPLYLSLIHLCRKSSTRRCPLHHHHTITVVQDLIRRQEVATLEACARCERAQGASIIHRLFPSTHVEFSHALNSLLQVETLADELRAAQERMDELQRYLMEPSSPQASERLLQALTTDLSLPAPSSSLLSSFFHQLRSWCHQVSIDFNEYHSLHTPHGFPFASTIE